MFLHPTVSILHMLPAFCDSSRGRWLFKDLILQVHWRGFELTVYLQLTWLHQVRSQRTQPTIRIRQGLESWHNDESERAALWVNMFSSGREWTCRCHCLSAYQEESTGFQAYYRMLGYNSRFWTVHPLRQACAFEAHGCVLFLHAPQLDQQATLHVGNCLLYILFQSLQLGI